MRPARTHDPTEKESNGYYSFPRRTWQRWRELGRTPKYTKLPNGELRIRRADYEAWLASLEVGAA